MNEGTTVLEHLNFFNKIINELLTVDVKIDEKDKVLIFLSRFHSYMITSLLSYFMVSKVLNIKYQDRIRWGFFISDIGGDIGDTRAYWAFISDNIYNEILITKS